MAALVVAAVTVSGVIAQTGDCRLPAGLIERRLAVEAAIDKRIQAQTGYANRDDLERQLRAIDAVYVHFMNDVVARYATDDHEFAVCCARQTDPVAKLFCGIVQFRRDAPHASDEFLASLPRTKVQRHVLWQLDEILAAESHDVSGWSEFPLPDGPTIAYVDIVFDLAKANAPEALEQYLHLLEEADGEYAEHMSDQIGHLLETDPSFVLARWATFRPHRRKLISETLPADQIQRIAEGFTAICTAPSKTCREVLALFPTGRR